jgi:uncharacterized protein YgiM (DUF1202 family)
MKNFRMSKKLLSILLAGGIAVTSLACTLIPKGSKNNVPISVTTSVADALPTDAPIAGEILVNEEGNIVEPNVTLTENIIDLPEQVALSSMEGIVVSDPIADIMREYEAYGLNEVHAKAAFLHDSNVRTGPDTTFKKVQSFGRGIIVEVLGRTANDWYLIKVSGETYFTIGSNIAILNYISDGMTMEDIVPNLALAIQPTTELNVRQEPRRDSYKLGLISGTRTYKVLDHLSNGWYKIDYQGTVAYVSGDYCRETYILDGSFYQYVSATHDCCLYDEYGNVKRYLERYEGGPVYNENSDSYLIWIGDEWGYIRRNDVTILRGRIIDVDLSLQEVTVYNGSEKLVQMDGCTGAAATPTDKGIHKLRGETGPTVLKGPGYSTPVDNFAGFNGGEGFHPLKCNNFGDVNGAASHGCVRLRPDRYTEFFDVTYSGDTVVVHK